MKTVIKALEIVQLQIFKCLNICTHFQTIPCNSRKFIWGGVKIVSTDRRADRQSDKGDSNNPLNFVLKL